MMHKLRMLAELPVIWLLCLLLDDRETKREHQRWLAEQRP